MSSQPDIPGYTLVSKIAEGGMAAVWRARQEKLDRVVAIKVMRKESDTDQREVERFIYEARAAASLIHPNIVQVIDAGELPEFLYYVMEYVPGPTAGDLVDAQATLPEAQVVQIATEVAEGLHYAWRDHKVVHCDIKPDNLLLHRNGRTKIADLGLAQGLGTEGVSIEEDMTIGTPNYFPPEQALVEEPFDCRTDMYALGASMYHMATGELPFGDEEPDEVASEQVHGQLPAPREVNKHLSKPFCGMVERLMAKKKEDRYPSWEDVLADLANLQRGEPLLLPPSSETRSTVAHTAQSSRKANKKIIRRRSRGLQPSPQVRIGKGTVASTHHTVQEAPSIWPTVVALSLLAGVLYMFTFLTG